MPRLNCDAYERIGASSHILDWIKNQFGLRDFH